MSVTLSLVVLDKADCEFTFLFGDIGSELNLVVELS